MPGHGLRRAAAIALVCASVIVAARAGAASDPSKALGPAGHIVSSALPPQLVPAALDTNFRSRPLPADPFGALRGAITDLSSLLAAPFSSRSLDWTDRMPGHLAGRLALTLESLAQCHRASDRALSWISPLELVRILSTDAAGPPPFSPIEIRDCAAELFLDTEALRAEASQSNGAGPAVDLWPVLKIESEGGNTAHLHDYALILDFGGDDTYLNNAGGSLLDLRRGPEGSAAPLKEPARGCALIVPHFAPLGDCSVSSAVLIDLAGNDVYGAMDTPEGSSEFLGRDVVTQVRGENTDADCTSDLLVRRMVTGGSGLAGVGILRDAGGNDNYLGRSLSQGSGHAGGVGILYDTPSDLGDLGDHYRAIRNSQGFGLAAGVGILRDEGGDDLFDFYMPAASTGKPGGVVSDQLVCDNFPRHIQGAGNIGAVGVLINVGGNDRYVSFFGSQGFGHQGGSGLLLELGGTDAYSGGPGRADQAQVVGPSSESVSGIDAFFDGNEI